MCFLPVIRFFTIYNIQAGARYSECIVFFVTAGIVIGNLSSISSAFSRVFGASVSPAASSRKHAAAVDSFCFFSNHFTYCIINIKHSTVYYNT